MTAPNLSLSEEDRVEIREILLAHRAEGVEHPLLPADVDFNNDGVVDSFGLDADDEVVVVHGVALEETVFRSEGDDFGHEDGS